MSKALISESVLTGIADAIRAKNGSTDTYTPAQMATAIEDIPTGITPAGQIEITENGTVDVAAFASALVNVAGGGGASNVVTGEFTTPGTGSGTFELPVDYSGDGYPVVIVIFDAANVDQKKAGLRCGAMIKERPISPKYSTDYGADMGEVMRKGYSGGVSYKGAADYVYSQETPSNSSSGWIKVANRKTIKMHYGGGGYNSLSNNCAYNYLVKYSE